MNLVKGAESQQVEVGKYRIIRLLPNDPFSRELLPKVYARAVEFIDRFGSQTDKVWLGQLLFANFYAQNNFIHVLVLLDDSSAIMAHSISYIEKHESLGNYCHILQVWKDVGDNEILDVGLPMIDEWARSLGISIVMANCADTPHERLYEQKGFKRWRVTVKREIGKASK